MMQFGIGFSVWCVAILFIRIYDKRQDNTLSTAEALHVAVCMAYIFWGIGWALAWVADVIKLAVI